MVNVGVGQDHGIEAVKGDRRENAVALALFACALMQAEIDEDPGPRGLYEIARACDFARRPEERNLHGESLRSSGQGRSDGERDALPGPEALLLALEDASDLDRVVEGCAEIT